MVALVIGIDTYDFVGKDGKQVQGSSVEMVTNIGGRLKLVKHTSGNIDFMKETFPVCPGIYEVDFQVFPSWGARFKPVISGALLIKEFPIDLDL
jgi:hypothetical protein